MSGNAPDYEEAKRVLSKVSTATITTKLFARGLRNTFLHGLGPVGGFRAPLVGQAFTLRYIPAREDVDVLAAFDDYDHPQRAAVEQTPPGWVLVMDCRGVDRAASAGDILLTRLARRGAAGMVTDGSVRDSGRIAELDLPVYVRSRAAMTNLAMHHAVDFDVPVGCAGVAVYPGDMIVGDADGVVCIPQHLVEEIAEEAHRTEAVEHLILERIRSGQPLRGNYPPDERTRHELERELAERGEPEA